MFSDQLWPRIGGLGRLFPIQFAATEVLGQEERYSFTTTLEGARRAQTRPLQARSWKIDVPFGRGEDVAAIEGLASGAWGGGPWRFLSVEAQKGNLLTPLEAELVERASVSTASLQDAGPVRDSTGSWAPRSVTVTLDSGWAALVRNVPVLPGKPFTFSCDVQGSSPQVHVEFRDDAGGVVGTQTRAGSGTSMQRVSATSVVPSGAVSATVGLRSQTLVATRPQVTWSEAPSPWSPGQGCTSAVILRGDSTLRHLEGGRIPVRSTTYDIMEVR